MWPSAAYRQRMEIRRPPTIAQVGLLVRAPWKRLIIGAVFAALYAISLSMWTATAGQPYQWALEDQKAKMREKASAAKEKGVAFTSGKQEKKDKDTELEIDESSLPSQILPSAWTCAVIFLSVTTHILFHLMTVWSVTFKALTLFEPTKKVSKGIFVKVMPHANKGKAAICEIEESEITLKHHFTFQYQAYEFVEPGDEDPELVGDAANWGVRLIQCPTNLKWDDYRHAKGLGTQGEVDRAQDKYGTNVFELPKPTFWQLFKKQLMAPLAIFQFFCTALWMLDTYWKYTCFTLLSVLGFEASTAFQRLKSMQTLRGMSMKSFSVWVFRLNVWQERPIEELLPGDVFSLVTKHESHPPADGAAAPQAKPDKKDITVPCDCLVLQGSAIVNEATLTGESVPQMKDALAASKDGDAKVDAFGKHRIHALFSGTSLIQATPAQEALADQNGTNGKEDFSRRPPDGGIVCFCLRTGFNSSQGELMRMIEFSTEDVGADKIETALQLLFLLMFALVAAGYVLKKGLEDPTRPTYKTLLRCILIITSVVPPSLPMQMAFAVHTALMSLMKSGIFCTEPFRVPYAGRIGFCFFDKTGTLTSDQMIAVGIVNGDGGKTKGGADVPRESLGVREVSALAAMVVAGCHSLIEVDGKAIGDPIEVAALRGIGWSYIPSASTASPGNWHLKELALTKQREQLASFRDDVEADRKEKAELQKKIEDLEKTLKQERLEAKKLQVTIEQRFHFSSELQRMSTICRVQCTTSAVQAGAYCLTKGSPEAIAKLVTSKPDWYDATYRHMAERGQRVLALAYRRLGNEQAAREFGQQSRDVAECGLTFAGFIAFKCETRKDSMLVIKALQDSRHGCVMLTGDAPLTALSVAHEVGIGQADPSQAFILSEKDDSVEWLPAITSGSGAKVAPQPFSTATLEELSKSHDLVVTGSAFEVVLQSANGPQMLEQLHHIRIFARLSPWQKEQVIRAVKTNQKVSTFMCGDGGNDVGALKEADVGLALLSGFGNANVGGGNAPQKDNIEDAEKALELQRQEEAERLKGVSKKATEELKRKRNDIVARQQQWVEEELEARRSRGEDVGVMGHMSAMKTVMGRVREELRKEQEAIQKKHGNAFALGAAQQLTDEFEGFEDTPMVQLGDASTAAPFTSRTPSISSVVDIIRQGRCTLLSAVQQMQIMMLESMISAYTMSTMSVDGTRPSEAQMMASGTLMSVASLAFTFARPVDRMHPVRPLSSVFHPAIFFSMIGQLLIHLGCMIYIASLAKDVMGPEMVKEIVEFEKERNKHIESLDEEAFNDWKWFMSVPFKSNLLNTCCWLVETSQQISVIFVNYKGRPWMKGLLENQPLFLSLFLCIALVAVCAWGAFPQLNELLNLQDVPDDLRFHVMGTLFVSLIGTFCWDRLMVAIFAPMIFQTQIEEAKSVTFMDFVPILKTVGYILGGLLLLGSGNPIIWGLAYMMYRNYNKAQEAPAATPAAAAPATRSK